MNKMLSDMLFTAFFFVAISIVVRLLSPKENPLDKSFNEAEKKKNL